MDYSSTKCTQTLSDIDSLNARHLFDLYCKIIYFAWLVKKFVNIFDVFMILLGHDCCLVRPELQ